MGLYDVVVVGAGPGGYVAAIRAAQLGLSTALVEKNEALGGTCLNVGCIPSKALLESSFLYKRTREDLAEFGIGVDGVRFDLSAIMSRKQRIVNELTGGIRILMKKNGVKVYHGTGRLESGDTVVVENADGLEKLKARFVVLATGSAPTEIPGLPFDHERIIDSSDALALSEVPEHLLVVGGGVIGLELGSVWARLGARVSVVEMLDRIVPFADKMVGHMLARTLKQQGLDIRTQTQLMEAVRINNGVSVTLRDHKGKEEKLAVDKLLVAVGRKPYTEGLGLEEVGVRTDRAGRILVDERFATNVSGIYALGDLIAGPMLAHKAEEEGVALAEHLAGASAHVNYEAIPSIVYTHPELAQVGRTEEALKEADIDYKVGKYFFKANGRAKTMNESEGLVKILADAKTDRLLGVHILGANASEMIGEVVAAFEFKASAEDLGRMIHAHPTLSEIIKEAALAVDKRAIHG